MKRAISFMLLSVLLSNFGCVDRCGECVSPPYAQCTFIFLDNAGNNLLLNEMLKIEDITLIGINTMEVISLTNYGEGVIVNFTKGTEQFLLTTPAKEFELKATVTELKGECCTSFSLTSFSIDGVAAEFEQPIFTFVL